MALYIGVAAALQMTAPKPLVLDEARAPPLVHYRYPAAATLQGDYDCAGKSVRLKVVAKDSVVVVDEYRGGAGVASKADLDRWNAALARFSVVTSIDVLCERDQEYISISGLPRDAADKNRKVNVYWNSGQLGILK